MQGIPALIFQQTSGSLVSKDECRSKRLPLSEMELRCGRLGGMPLDLNPQGAYAYTKSALAVNLEDNAYLDEIP